MNHLQRKDDKNCPITSRPITKQTMKLLMKPAHEGGMSAPKMMEFKGEYDDIENTFNEIINEFMHDTCERISPLSDLEIHTQAVQDFQDAVKVSRGMKNGKATTPLGIPSEIWKIILNPNKVFTKQRYGI